MKYLLFLSLFSIPAFALDRTIQVQGTCEVKVTPDRGTITFTAENQSKNQKEAANKTNGEINKLKEKIKEMKLADLELKNTEYSVWPVRDYEKDKVVDKGIRVQLGISVTTSEISRFGEVMGYAAQIGIKNVGSLQTFLSLEKNRAEYANCLEIAAENARHKAKKLAKKLDFEVGEVVNLIESPSVIMPPSPSPYPMAKAMRSDMSSMETTQIEAGEHTYSTTLLVSFGIK